MKKFLYFALMWIFATTIFAQTSPTKYLIKYLESNTPQPDYGVTFLSDNQFVYKSPSTEKIDSDSKKLSVSNLFIATIGDEGEIIEKKQIQGIPTNKITKTGAAYSKDLKTVYFSAMKYRKKRKRNDREQLFKADIDAEGNWVNMVKLPFSNSKYSFGEPALSTNGKELYFTSDMPSTIGGADIFVVDLKEDGSFGKVRNLGSTINTIGNEVTAYISKDNMLYFSSDGHPNGLGNLDVYVSDLSINNLPSKPVHLDAPINSASDDFSFITFNDKRGYFASNRLQGQNNHDIYSFLIEEVIKDEKCVQEIVGIVKDKETELAIKDATITLFDDDNKQIKQIKTDEKGAYKFVLDCNNTYTLKASGELYSTEEHLVNTANYLKAPILEANKFLVKKSAEEIENIETVIAKADDVKKEEEDNQIIEDVKTAVEGATEDVIVSSEITDKNENEIVDTITETKVVVQETKVKEDTYNTEEKIVEEVVDTNDTTEEDEATINPVYFAFDKSNISTKAAKELDKIAKILNKNNSIHIEVSSYTDSRGSYAYNLKLSERRARASADYLVALGVDRSRITTKGLGESKMVNKCFDGIECSEAAHEKNRRTEFAFTNPQVTLESSNYESQPIKSEVIKEEATEDITIIESIDEKIETVNIEADEVKEKALVEDINTPTYADTEESSDESFSELDERQSLTNLAKKEEKLTALTETSEENKVEEKRNKDNINPSIKTDDKLTVSKENKSTIKPNRLTEEEMEEVLSFQETQPSKEEVVVETNEPESQQNAFNKLISEAEVERINDEAKKPSAKSGTKQIDNSVPNKLLAEITSQVVQPKTKPVKPENRSLEKPVKSSVKDETTIVANTVIVKALQSKKGKYIETTKSKRVQALRVTFRLQQNYLASKGYKDAYIVIQKQDGKVINEKGVFTLANGKEKPYSDETTLYYNNQSIKIVMFIDKIVHKFSKGVYLVDIYVEGHLVGSNTLMLVS